MGEVKKFRRIRPIEGNTVEERIEHIGEFVSAEMKNFFSEMKQGYEKRKIIAEENNWSDNVCQNGTMWITHRHIVEDFVNINNLNENGTFRINEDANPKYSFLKDAYRCIAEQCAELDIHYTVYSINDRIDHENSPTTIYSVFKLPYSMCESLSKTNSMSDEKETISQVKLIKKIPNLKCNTG